MADKIIFATGNKNKMREIRDILSDLGMEILSMKEAGIDKEINEDGKTFEENALIKARAVAEDTDAVVLADDSGLERYHLRSVLSCYASFFRTSLMARSAFPLWLTSFFFSSDNSAVEHPYSSTYPSFFI